MQAVTGFPANTPRSHLACRGLHEPVATDAPGVGPAHPLASVFGYGLGAGCEVAPAPARGVLVVLRNARAVVGAEHASRPERRQAARTVPRQRDVHVRAVALVVVLAGAVLGQAAVVLLPLAVPGAPHPAVEDDVHDAEAAGHREPVAVSVGLEQPDP